VSVSGIVSEVRAAAKTKLQGKEPEVMKVLQMATVAANKVKINAGWYCHS
jgi:hypothetical protein